MIIVLGIHNAAHPSDHEICLKCKIVIINILPLIHRNLSSLGDFSSNFEVFQNGFRHGQ